MTHYDAVIVGSGVAGSLLAAKLSEKGQKVLILEAGPRAQERGAMLEKFWASPLKSPSAPYEDSPFAPRSRSGEPESYYEQRGEQKFLVANERLAGGTTWHWLGQTPRLLPADFKMATLYQRGLDWPLDYAALEPWYCRAEAELGVAGDSRDDLGSPRSQAYPFRPIPLSYLDKQIALAVDGQTFEGRPLKVSATPQARNPDLCLGSRSCIPLCPTGAKYEARVHLEKAVKLGAELRTQAVVSHLTVAPSGLIAELTYKTWDGHSHKVQAKNYLLAAGAIENARLLLLSAQERCPDGVANSSGQVGRNLMDHPSQLSWALSPEPLYPYRGPFNTAGFDTLREGDFRKTRAAFRLQIQNDGWGWPLGAPESSVAALIEKGLFGSALVQELERQCTRHLFLVSMVEQLPDPANRVTLSQSQKDALGLAKPAITYRLGAYEQAGFLAAIRAHDFVFKRLGATQRQHRDFAAYESADHSMGTHRMGQDAKTAVVDANLRAHDHKNLFLLGCGVLPTAGTANPTLTLAALTLRLAALLLA